MKIFCTYLQKLSRRNIDEFATPYEIKPHSSPFINNTKFFNNT